MLLMGSLLFSHSCANTTTPPSGGDKDTIPPVIVGINPLPGSTNVPLNSSITITFDEYVKVKDPKSIFLSPPLEKAPKHKMKGKSLIIYNEGGTLKENTTYTLDLTNAIADNNEGNMFPGYTLVFSTGDHIDEMVVTGTVVDCNSLKPIKGATVMLYKDHSDSAVFKSRPDAAMKTDEWGYFALRNVKDTSYRLYAMRDEANNNLYDPENDRIAFADSLIVPTMVANDTLKELLKYDMKDTTRCLARISEHELRVFRERPTKQMIVNKVRVGDRTAYMTFMAEDPTIDSIWVAGIPGNRIITQFNDRKDSLELWVHDRRPALDTMHIFVDYLKTDSTGTPVPHVEHIRLASDKPRVGYSRRKINHEDTICVMTVTAEDKDVEQKGFGFEFKYPIIYENFDSLTLKSVNPRQQEKLMKFTVTRDSTNLRKYTLMPDEKLLSGYDYKLKVPEKAFRDINGFYNDSTDVSVTLPKDDKLSTLVVNMTGVNHRYIVDLLNEKRDKVLRSYQITKDTELKFPYISKGKYSIRITEDVNKNGIVDSGNLLQHKQPEKVKFFKLKNDSFIFEVLEGTEVMQNINVHQLFKD